MAIILRFLIVLLVTARVTTLSVPPAKAAWLYFDAKSQIVASLLWENMSALMWSSVI
jgi:hypothetical protein